MPLAASQFFFLSGNSPEFKLPHFMTLDFTREKHIYLEDISANKTPDLRDILQNEKMLQYIIQFIDCRIDRTLVKSIPLCGTM